MQWHLTHPPELVKKLRGLMKEADRELIGVGDVHLRCKYQPAKSQVRVALLSAKSNAHATPIIQPTEQWRSTDGDLTVAYCTPLLVIKEDEQAEASTGQANNFVAAS